MVLNIGFRALSFVVSDLNELAMKLQEFYKDLSAMPPHPVSVVLCSFLGEERWFELIS